MKCTAFRTGALILMLLSIGLLIVGIIVPAWTRVWMSVATNAGHIDISVNLGFFITNFCTIQRGTPEVCMSSSSNQIFKMMKLQQTESDGVQQSKHTYSHIHVGYL